MNKFRIIALSQYRLHVIIIYHSSLRSLIFMAPLLVKSSMMSVEAEMSPFNKLELTPSKNQHSLLLAILNGRFGQSHTLLKLGTYPKVSFYRVLL